MTIAKLWKRPGRRGVILGVLCALVAWGVTQDPMVRGLEEWFQDGLFAIRGRRTSRARDRIILVTLDDPSLDRLGKPLAYLSPELARAVTYLKAQGAAAIGVDMFVPKSMAALPDLQKDQPGDAEAMGLAVQQAGGDVVLADWQLDDGWLEPLQKWMFQHFLDPQLTDVGFVNLTDDADTFLRRQQLLVRQGAEPHLHFALALFARAHAAKVEWTEDGLRVAGEQVPLDAEQKLRINFVGPPGSFRVLPLHDVLAAEKTGGKLELDPRGAIMILCVTARSQQDYHATPYANNFWRTFSTSPSGLMSGGEVHANLVATLEDGAYLRELPWWASLGVLLAFGAVLGKAFARLGLAAGFGLAFVHHWAWKGLSLAALVYLHLRVEMVAMLLLGALAYGVTFVSRWWVLRRMLGVVKSERLAWLVENDPEALERDEHQEVTVLFADIRGFTTYSETHGAAQVKALLNAYFTAVVPIIEAHHGMLNQYMGDGMMVLFGAPLPLPRQELWAVRAAVAIVRRVHQLQPQWAGLDFADLRIGVGIHTGRVVTGMVGSPRRLDYSAIGDTTNTASRIESQTKEWGVEILISEATFRELEPKERVELGCSREGRSAEVKHKKQRLVLHTVDPGWGEKVDNAGKLQPDDSSRTGAAADAYNQRLAP